MMRRGWLLAMSGVVVAVALVGVLALQVAAQEVPPSPVPPGPVPVQPNACSVAKYDINKDGRLSEADLDRWKRMAYGGGECQVGAEAGRCPQGMDLDNDGFVTLDDVQSWLQHYRECLRSRRTDVG